MENSTNTNGMQVGYAEAKRDVMDVKTMFLFLRQLEDLTDRLESLSEAMDEILEHINKDGNSKPVEFDGNE